MSRLLIHIRQRCFRKLAKPGVPNRAMDMPPKKHHGSIVPFEFWKGTGWCPGALHSGGSQKPEFAQVEFGVGEWNALHDKVKETVFSGGDSVGCPVVRAACAPPGLRL